MPLTSFRAVQIAKSFGAEVTGVDSTKKLEIMRSVGADFCLDYTKEDFIKKGIGFDDRVFYSRKSNTCY
ncbi:MAG: zinc-binding dehydrogenase [Spirochaetales bacterium]|nr:zinc-binding dehydrogenase [Spirochaetales bacterium]